MVENEMTVEVRGRRAEQTRADSGGGGGGLTDSIAPRTRAGSEAAGSAGRPGSSTATTAAMMPREYAMVEKIEVFMLIAAELFCRGARRV